MKSAPPGDTVFTFLRSKESVFAGLKWDRHWMITNANGRFQTQRNIPKLALIEVTMPVEALDSSWGPLSPDAALCEFTLNVAC